MYSFNTFINQKSIFSFFVTKHCLFIEQNSNYQLTFTKVFNFAVSIMLCGPVKTCIEMALIKAKDGDITSSQIQRNGDERPVPSRFDALCNCVT